jgi:hypothetical protein
LIKFYFHSPRSSKRRPVTLKKPGKSCLTYIIEPVSILAEKIKTINPDFCHKKIASNTVDLVCEATN